MHKANITDLLKVGFLFVCFLSACSGQPDRESGPVATALPDPAQVATTSPTASPIPLRRLTVCTGREPASLFLYADSSLAARNIRQAIYDGPIDQYSFQFAPVILEKLPSLADGDVTFEPVQVLENDIIADSQGNLTNLKPGTLFMPSGCNLEGCAVPYESQGQVGMDQLVARFKLRPGLQWSDGSPLTADDSLFSYEVAKSLYPQARADLLAHTQSYRALDGVTLEWRGVPGYRDPEYASNFFSPLPRQAWNGIAPAQLITNARSVRTPLGWGPYVIQGWESGKSITLGRNPNYWRAGEGLPRFDELVFRFMPGAEAALQALQAGECDLIDDTLSLETQGASLDELQAAGKVALAAVSGTGWEHADFGLLPSQSNPQKPALFQSKEMRQAIAQCIDRQAMASELAPGQPGVPDAYLPPNHPLFNPQVRRYTFDPAGARALLDSLAWLEGDGDPATPRQSLGVPGVPDGTPLIFSYLTTVEPQKQRAAQILKESLAQCGVQVELASLPAEALYNPGPEGPLFGRNFDMAQFGWSTASEPPCSLYATQEIPGFYPESPKGWGGANASGYSNPDYDRACRIAMNTLPDEALHREAHLQAQAIFAEDLPAIPLYWLSRVAALRPDLCNAVEAASGEFALWNLELFDYGENCGKP